MIIGVGIDLVDLARFERAVTKTPKLLERLFVETEREVSMTSLAGRFAAKEAFVKALGWGRRSALARSGLGQTQERCTKPDGERRNSKRCGRRGHPKISCFNQP